ncbi:PKD-like family lipoprotein [Sphingobacterium sp. HJSM2_6]|uniref:PKD-like family lipoprotein n=1 Tax=Sphingobacterium sp. HJSM2_6 TaxID=3366264 RepID=UPI003BBD03AC
MKNLNLLYIFLVIITASSCNKDLGNYNYIQIDSLIVKDIPKTIEIGLGQPMIINPSITSKFENIELDNLSFEWIAYNPAIGDATKSKIILGREKNLNQIPPLLVGNYNAYLKITDNSSGRIWTYPYSFSINGAFGKWGWIVLSEKNKETHLDYYQDDLEQFNSYPIIYRNVNLLSNNAADGTQLVLNGEPISMETYMNQDGIYRTAKNYLYLNTSTNTYKINLTDGFAYNTLLYNYKFETASGKPAKADYIYPGMSNIAMTLSDGNLYSYYYNLSKVYNIPLNANNDGTLYQVSKYIANPMSNSNMNILFFDKDNKRFMRANINSIKANPVLLEESTFNTADTKMDLVWMDHTLAFNGQAVAIMKKEEHYFLIRFNFNRTGTLTLNSVTEVTNLLTDIRNASHFTIDQQYGYLFYTANDKLYQFDMDAKVIKTVKSLNGRKVSMLKYERLVSLATSENGFNTNIARMAPIGYSIIVGTYSESDPQTSGKVEFWMVKPLMGELTQALPTFEGLGKVVDVQYTDRY